MKKQNGLWLLVMEAVLCAAAAVLLRGTAGVDAGIFAFPFVQIGQGLRALSLSGTGGNAAAIAIYVVLSLFPMGIFIWRMCKAPRDAEQLLLPLMSATLFGVLYVMVNPALLSRMQLPGKAIGQAALGGLLYAELCAYLVLRILRGAFRADAAQLRRYLTALLAALGVVFVYAAFGANVTELFSQLDALQTANTDGGALGWTRAFLVLRMIADSVSLVLDVWVILAALALLSARKVGDSEQAAAAAEKIAARSRISLSVSVLLPLTLYIAQLLMAGKLRQTAFSVSLPLQSVAFCLGTLLLVRLMQENRRLQADNDLFI